MALVSKAEQQQQQEQPLAFFLKLMYYLGYGGVKIL
jgi:hypothetical protein